MQGNIYSIIADDGKPEFAPYLPIGDASADTGELYLAKTEAVRDLEEGDVIALASTDLYPTGITVKIVKIHPTGEAFSHFTIQCPTPEEQFDMDEFRKFNAAHKSNSNTFGGTSDAEYLDWIPLTPNAEP